MAKSARSKSKIRHRNVRRETIYGPAEAERIKRLAEKQSATSGIIDMEMLENIDNGDAHVSITTTAGNDENNDNQDRMVTDKEVLVAKPSDTGSNISDIKLRASEIAKIKRSKRRGGKKVTSNRKGVQKKSKKLVWKKQKL
ncbi:hypothetical protein EV182_004401 [Spiromyces aspiralis]|uniref:Uncharacterized protein n=1 Tax=Spiromyces aspiralis TaxID=68401 RepID=A0ACC1HF56_9FUNG|nr:hypothetical protein EV182_004401 [Spiromyces aspiralis]